MREIKVRAWDEDAGEMLFSKDVARNPCDSDLQILSDENGLYFYYYATSPDGEAIEDCEFRDLQQFTGSKDRNDVEIYDLDICLVDIKVGDYPHELKGLMTGLVEWEVDKWIITPKKYEGEITRFFGKDTIYDYLPHSVTDKRNIEVIGNIYENPELLKD